MADETTCLIIIGIVLTITFLTIIGLVISMDSIQPLHYGITYNKLSKFVSTDVYENGRYLIGPLTSFIIYPGYLVNMEFSSARRADAAPLETRTAEGLALSLHISFQYKLNKDELHKLYYLANMNYAGTYMRIARDTVLKVCGHYNATNYWTDRATIGDTMKDALAIEIRKAFGVIVNFQILRVDLPHAYEDSIVLTQVEVQKSNMRKFEQTAELIRQGIGVMDSEAKQLIRVINATAHAEAYKIEQFAVAQALNNTISVESRVYDLLKQKTQFTNGDVMNYLFLDSMRDKKDAKILVGLSNGLVNVGMTTGSGPN